MLLEMSSITTPNKTVVNIYTRYIFQRFLRKISVILPICIMQKINLEVLCKRNCFAYGNSCKRLPNFVNMAALVFTDCQSTHSGVTSVKRVYFIMRSGFSCHTVYGILIEMNLIILMFL